MEIVDAHLHLWSPGSPGHVWPTPADGSLHRNFDVATLRHEAGALNLSAAVLVQAQPNDAGTEWLLAVADREPLIAAVVGWVDLASPVAPDRIALLAQHQRMRGLRPMLQAMEDDDWLLRADLSPAIEAMIAHGLSLDALVETRHLPMLARFADNWPDLPIVIDHAAKPSVEHGEIDPWRDHIAALGKRGLYSKLSGLRTEQAADSPANALAPYVEHLLAHFDGRLMWGSDWPVLNRSGSSYEQWAEDARNLSGLDEARQQSLFSRCARHFYRIDIAGEAV
ncbi:MAG: amidohydrolase family protein [Sphingobium sp.]